MILYLPASPGSAVILSLMPLKSISTFTSLFAADAVSAGLVLPFFSFAEADSAAAFSCFTGSVSFFSLKIFGLFGVSATAYRRVALL
jgi:hypothetical protein